MKLRMLAAYVSLSLFTLLSPARAQIVDPADLDGFWYSCAGTKDFFDIEPKDHRFMASQGGVFTSGKYHVKGNQITFAGRTLIMTDGELDEGSTHWVNGISLLKTNCPGAASHNQAALTENRAAIPEKPEIKEKNAQQQAAVPVAEPRNSGAAGAGNEVKNENTLVSSATESAAKSKGGGQAEGLRHITPETFQGQEAISFRAEYFCRDALLVGQVGYCGFGPDLYHRPNCGVSERQGQGLVQVFAICNDNQVRRGSRGRHI